MEGTYISENFFILGPMISQEYVKIVIIGNKISLTTYGSYDGSANPFRVLNGIFELIEKDQLLIKFTQKIRKNLSDEEEQEYYELLKDEVGYNLEESEIELLKYIEKVEKIEGTILDVSFTASFKYDAKNEEIVLPAKRFGFDGSENKIIICGQTE